MILSLKGVTKKYKLPKSKMKKSVQQTKKVQNEIVAVDNINLDINQGESIGYIGLNGAGKSTTIKLMTGILTPTAGEITMFGENVLKKRNNRNRQFSVVFGQRSNLWYDLPVIDTYNYIRVLYDVPKERYKENLKRISQQLEIEELLNRPVRKLSLGQKMKCELGMSLLYDPKLLFLDEPTLGLDIIAKDNFLKCIEEIKRTTDITVILTTHNMDEISKYCKRIVVLDQGKILFDGPIEGIMNIVGNTQKIALILEESEKLSKDMVYNEFKVSHTHDGRVELEIDKNQIDSAKVINYYFQNYTVRDVNIENSNLEQLIRKLYSR